jgi:single-strand DNA-binding protein
LIQAGYNRLQVVTSIYKWLQMFTLVYKRIQTLNLRLVIFSFSALFYEISSFVSFLNLKFNIMANLRNQIRLIGNLGGNPTIKEINGGKKVAKFTLATNETYLNDKGEKVTETQWHNLVCWGRLVGIAEKYLIKGQEIAIEGKLTSRSWQDKEGNRRSISEIVVSDMVMLGKKQQSSEEAA